MEVVQQTAVTKLKYKMFSTQSEQNYKEQSLAKQI
jgi:hypothetical protein